MWRPWDDNTTEVFSDTENENSIQVVPETDDNKVEDTSTPSIPQNAAQGTSMIIPETQDQQHAQDHHQQFNYLRSPNYMQYIYLQSEHNQMAGQLLLNILNKLNKILKFKNFIPSKEK